MAFGGAEPVGEDQGRGGTGRPPDVDGEPRRLVSQHPEVGEVEEVLGATDHDGREVAADGGGVVAGHLVDLDGGMPVLPAAVDDDAAPVPALEVRLAADGRAEGGDPAQSRRPVHHLVDEHRVGDVGRPRQVVADHQVADPCAAQVRRETGRRLALGQALLDRRRASGCCRRA